MPAAVREKDPDKPYELPRRLYDEARLFVEQDTSPANTINDFFVTAISAYVRVLKRKQVDAAFAGMGEDADYQREARLIAEEFSPSDWEAFELAERETAKV